MAIVDKKWDGSASRYPDTPSYCDASLINNNTGERGTWIQANCKLPVKEPNGDINVNAVHAAAAALAGARNELEGVAPADKKNAARALVKIYGQMQADPPPTIKNMAQ